MYGKQASEFGTFKFAKSGIVSGSANYVTGYTGFNGSNAEEQEGYYLPIAFKPSAEVKEAYMKVIGSENPAVKMDANNIVFLGKDDITAGGKEIEITSGYDRFILKASGLAFAQALQKSRKSKG